MNERIEKLIEQAGIESYPAKLLVNTDKEGKVSSKWEIPLEKFAELIVSECSDIIKHRAETSADYFDDIKVNDHARQVQRDCAQTLRLSFGLETFGEKE